MGRAARAREQEEATEAAAAAVTAGGTVILPPATDVRLERGSRLELQQADGAARPTFLIVTRLRSFPNGRVLLQVERDLERSPAGTPPGQYTLRVESPLTVKGA